MVTAKGSGPFVPAGTTGGLTGVKVCQAPTSPTSEDLPTVAGDEEHAAFDDSSYYDDSGYYDDSSYLDDSSYVDAALGVDGGGTAGAAGAADSAEGAQRVSALGIMPLPIPGSSLSPLDQPSPWPSARGPSCWVAGPGCVDGPSRDRSGVPAHARVDRSRSFPSTKLRSDPPTRPRSAGPAELRWWSVWSRCSCWCSWWCFLLPLAAGQRQQQRADQYVEPSPTFEPGEPAFVVQIPAIGLNQVVVSGSEPAELRGGPGWRNGTASPGQGNTVVLGRSTLSGAPFGRVDDVPAGSVISVRTIDGRVYRYRVDRVADGGRRRRGTDGDSRDRSA